MLLLRGLGRFCGPFGRAAVQCFYLLSLLSAVLGISYMLISLSPIDPVQAYIGADMLLVGPEQREAIAAYWGLDRPPLERFARWAAAFVHGDLGTSMIYREPVATVIRERFLNSVSLMASAWLISGLIGFALGVVAAVHKDTRIDRILSWMSYTLVATPAFWLGLVLIIVFAAWLKWLPIGLSAPIGVLKEHVSVLDRLRHLVLPTITLSVVGIPPIVLHTRQKLIDVMQSDHFLYARARGETGWRLIFRHGLRHIALPAISLQFASFGELFGGSVLVESVFAYPGLGKATVEAGVRGDVPLLLGIVLFSTLFVFAGNRLADGLYRRIDPRMRERHG